jgi:hypothetical protein
VDAGGLEIQGHSLQHSKLKPGLHKLHSRRRRGRRGKKGREKRGEGGREEEKVG